MYDREGCPRPRRQCRVREKVVQKDKHEGRKRTGDGVLVV